MAIAPPKDLVIIRGNEEANVILKCYHPTIGENETWAILDAKWYGSWARYSGLKTDGTPIPEETGAPRPGPVDNTRLQSTLNPSMLKTDISEGQDYVLVHIDVWNKYMEWYGGGPAFIRGTIAQGNARVVRVEMYPVFLHLHEVKGEGADETSAKFQSYSGKLSINDIIKTLTPAAPAATTTPAATEGAATPAAATDGKDAKDNKEVTVRIWMWEEPPEEKKDTAAATATAAATPAPGGPATDAAAAPAATDAPAAGAGTGDAAATATAAAPEKPKRKKDNWRLLEGNVSLSTPLDGLGIEKTKPIKVLVERVNTDGTWPRAAYVKDWKDFEVGDGVDCQDTVGKWYQSKVRDVKPDTVYIHFEGWAESWDEWLPRNSARLAPKNTHTSGPRIKPQESSGWGGMTWSYGSSEDGRPSCSGAVGLRNLGNTCFMNSTLACLGHSPALTDYFLEDRYLSEINRDNPLGWKGKVAEEYGAMTKEVWSDKYTTVAPKKFKDAIGQFAPRFSGYQQQDSSELLSFLLDGLHEDLNRILKKPATPAIESKGRPDDVVAAESWVNYKKRNDSIIVDLMQGQLKSRLQCPIAKCGRVSITFDPFMFLSAPLPTIVDKVQEVVLVSATPGRPLTIYGCTVSTHGRVGDLRKALSDVSGVPARRLVICELWSGRVYRFMEDDVGLNEIRPNEHIYAYEVPQLDELKQDGVPVQVINQRMEKNPAYDPSWPASREYVCEVFGLPRVFCVPRRSQLTSRQLRALVAQTMAPTHAAGVTPFKICSLMSDARNCLKCGYTSTCTGCETAEDDAVFDMGDRDAKAAFGLQWTDASAYNKELDQAVRDRTADVSVMKRESSIDLGDCLRSFTKQETLSESDPWRCPDCKDFRQAYKKFDIWTLPELLVIHLKRFQYTRTWRDKLSTFVDFPVEGLDMGQFCVNPEFKGEKALYDLYGVSNHMGNMGGGHYTAYVKNMSSGKWYCHDDSRVYPVNVTEIKSTSAYVLFYKRRTLPASKRALTGGEPAATTTAATPAAST